MLKICTESQCQVQLAPEGAETGSLVLPDPLKEYTHGSWDRHTFQLSTNIMWWSQTWALGLVGLGIQIPAPSLWICTTLDISDPFLTSVFLCEKIILNVIVGFWRHEIRSCYYNFVLGINDSLLSRDCHYIKKSQIFLMTVCEGVYHTCKFDPKYH